MGFTSGGVVSLVVGGEISFTIAIARIVSRAISSEVIVVPLATTLFLVDGVESLAVDSDPTIRDQCVGTRAKPGSRQFAIGVAGRSERRQNGDRDAISLISAISRGVRNI